MLLAVLVSIAIGVLFGNWTKGMNVGQIAFGMWVALLSAIAGGLIGMWTNAVVGSLVFSVLAGPIAFSIARRVCR